MKGYLIVVLFIIIGHVLLGGITDTMPEEYIPEEYINENESDISRRGLRYWMQRPTPFGVERYRCDPEQNYAEFIEMGEYERVHKQEVSFFVEFKIKNAGECVWFPENAIIYDNAGNRDYFDYAYTKPATFDSIIYPGEIGTSTLEVLILHKDWREISGIPLQVQYQMRFYMPVGSHWGRPVDWVDQDGNKIWGNIFEGLETQPMYLEFFVLEEFLDND